MRRRGEGRLGAAMSLVGSGSASKVRKLIQQIEAEDTHAAKAGDMRAWRLMKRRVYPIGVEQLWRHGEDRARWAVSLDNATFRGWFEIPPERLAAWKDEFRVGLRTER